MIKVRSREEIRRTIKSRIREIDLQISRLRAKQSGLEDALNVVDGMTEVVRREV